MAALPGCVATPAAAGLAEGQEVVVEGRVASVDRAPMAYDGDGLIALQTEAHGMVTVHVPARSNLCKAQGLGVFDAIAAGMRVRAAGTANGPAEVTVCNLPTHRLALVQQAP